MVGVEVPEEAGMTEGVEGGTGVPEVETGVPEGVTEEVAKGTPAVIVEGVAEDKRTPEMTDDDIVFVSERATEVPKGKKRANDAPELMVVTRRKSPQLSADQNGHCEELGRELGRKRLCKLQALGFGNEKLIADCGDCCLESNIWTLLHLDIVGLGLGNNLLQFQLHCCYSAALAFLKIPVEPARAATPPRLVLALRLIIVSNNFKRLRRKDDSI
ncbi:Hypothetical predicted protein [Olea europaea subsp. europaea]|uniref:Uncharacterized protein n=1 Tax=Olea europaea subsp. europaea TaxID=158383 RepID=A0A8S0SX36_OLEEU|nr:Hypothetical predicted protein [Olea europaea subsp. europaea]